MKESEQREILVYIQGLVKRTWLRHCLTTKITRKRATLETPAEWRLWVYVKGLPKLNPEDGCTNAYLFRPADYDEKRTPRELLALAMDSPYAKDYISD